MNRKEQQFKRRQATVTRRPVKKKKTGRLARGTGVPTKTNAAVIRGHLFSSPLDKQFMSPPVTSGLLLTLNASWYPAGGATRGVASKLRSRRLPPPQGRRRGQGVITGLAAKKPSAVLKRGGTFTRGAANQVLEESRWVARADRFCTLTPSV